MKIVFYSSNANFFDPNLVHIKTIPSRASQWMSLQKKFPEHQFVLVTQLPGTFLVDYENESLRETASGVNVIFSKAENAEEFAEEILALKPDVAIAASFWISPYDWLVLNDALIGEKIREKGIDVICHNSETAFLCFDKFETRKFLEKNNFNLPKAVYVRHEMFWAERKSSDIKLNVYKEKILKDISRLNFPVVIKDTTGMSSYGIDVVKTFGEVRCFLNSKKFNSDRLIEEFLPGLQFGTEIRGRAVSGNYRIFSPFLFSVNQYGITSPKQSVKLGPIDSEDFDIKSLKEELLRLAKLLELDGTAQVDLVYSNRKWFILEINPRLSGMTESVCVSENKGLYESLLELTGNFKSEERKSCVLDIKFPVLDDEMLEKLSTFEKIKFLNQTKNDAAKQRREMGFCEAILSAGNFEKLDAALDELNEKYADIMESVFYENAKKMLGEMKK